MRNKELIDMKYEADRFLISLSKDNNDYFALVWDIWLKSLKEPYGYRQLFHFKDNTSKKEIDNTINQWIDEMKNILRKEFTEEYEKEKIKIDRIKLK